jgi:hypothetical protein
MKPDSNTGTAETTKGASAPAEESKNKTSAPKGVSEELIAEKVRAGLTREQAIQVIEAQAENDKASAAKK